MLESSDKLARVLEHSFYSRVIGAWGGREKRAAFHVTDDGCVHWTGSVNSKGYPIDRGGLIHRQAWEAINGPIPSGWDVHHICKHKTCARIDHLLAVSREEHVRLERGSRKLSESDVIEIRALSFSGMRDAEVAALFSIDRSYVSRLRRGQAWRGVGEVGIEELLAA